MKIESRPNSQMRWKTEMESNPDFLGLGACGMNNRIEINASGKDRRYSVQLTPREAAQLRDWLNNHVDGSEAEAKIVFPTK